MVYASTSLLNREYKCLGFKISPRDEDISAISSATARYEEEVALDKSGDDMLGRIQAAGTLLMILPEVVEFCPTLMVLLRIGT